MSPRWVLATVLLLCLASFPLSPVSGAHVAGPHLVEMSTLDLRDDTFPDPNGKIDTIRFEFDAPIDASTIHLDEFDVEDFVVVGYDFNLAKPTILDLILLENHFDTAIMPVVTWAADHSLADANGDPVDMDVGTYVDGAGPVLIGAVGGLGSDIVTLRFSEPVTVAGGLDESHFEYKDDSTSGPSSIKAGSVVHTDSTSIAQVALDSTLASPDVNKDVIGPKADIKDAAGNDAHAGFAPLQLRTTLEVRGNIGEDVVRAIFSVPVQKEGGGDLTAHSAFDVVYDAPPANPIAGVSGVSHEEGWYEAVIVLTDPVKAEDVRSLEPARLQTLAGNLEEFIPAGTSITPQPIPFSTTAFVDKDRPYATEVFTLDRNRNGFLDAVEIHWSEPVTPQCQDGIWLEYNGDPDLYKKDLLSTALPIMSGDGLIATVPLKERTTADPDTGLVPSLVSVTCSSGDAPFVDHADPPNPAFDILTGAISEQDMANPVIVVGATFDNTINGFIDQVTLTFSEKMVEVKPLVKESWIVEGYEVESVSLDQGIFLHIRLKEGDVGDTGVLPDVSYDGTELADAAGNALRGFEGGGFEVIDLAPPRAIAAYGDEGSKLIRVEFSEGVEAITDPQNEPAGPGRSIQEKDFAFTSSGGGNTGIVDVRHNRGDRMVFIDTAQPLEEADFTKGSVTGDQIQPLPKHIREVNDRPRADRATVGQEFFGFIEKDVDAPSAPSDLAWTPSVTNATLTFTAPADDAIPKWNIEPKDTGAVTSYRVYVNETGLPADLDTEAFMDLPQWGGVTASPAIPVAPGESQSLVIGGLCSSNPYHVALVALDEDGNPSKVVEAPALTTQADTTAPVGAMTFLSSTHQIDEDGNPVSTPKVQGNIAWDNVDDPDACELTFHWAIDENKTADVTVADNATTDPGTQFTVTHPLPATLYMHVAAANDDGLLSQTFTYPLHVVPPTDCDPGNVTMPDLQVVSEGGFTELSWGELPKELPENVELRGYQVWLQAKPGEPWERRTLLEAPAVGFEERKYVDNAKVTEKSRYIVTAYFTDNLCQLAVDEDGFLVQSLDETGNSESFLDDFDSTDVEVVQPPPRVPTWAWVTLSAISLMVIGGVGLFYGLRRTKLDESWLEEDEELVDDDVWGSDPINDLSAGEGAAEDDPFAQETEAEAPAEGMEISCPACTHVFAVSGSRPMQIECPNCHAGGVLE